MNEVKWESYDGSPRDLLLWDEGVEKPRGVLQIIHGMAEHASRYDDFARFLNATGYIVAALELRAHKGSTVLGHEEGNVFEKTTRDNLALTTYLAAKYKRPISTFGHSYGSFITQNYIQYNPDIACVILSGSAARTDTLSKVGFYLSSAQKLAIDGAKPAKMIDRLTFGAFDKPFKSENRRFAWLSRDEEACKKYIEDPFCGYTMSINFQVSLLGALQRIFKDENVAKVNRALPIMIISGDRDPVGGNGKFVEELYGLYLKNGLKKIKYKLYKEARHEIINEINKEEVYGDVLAFLNVHNED